MTNVDIFDDLVDDTNSDVDASSTESTTNSESENQVADSSDAGDVSPETQNENDAEAGEASEDDKPVETVSSIPDGAVSVTEFAQHVTQELMKAKVLAGETLDGSEYTVPQEVYQTVKAQRDRIPHVLVKRDNEKEARVCILKDEAFVWWMARREKLSTRGMGAKSASARTPEDNLVLLGQAVNKNLYAKSRQQLWNERVDQTAKLVEKYQGFLSDANVDSDTVELAIQEATNAFNAEQAQKAAEKAAKAKKSGKSADTDENED